MVASKLKFVQSAVALALLGCAVCPFIEVIIHWNSSIFLTGHDTESTVAFLLLLIELSFAIGKLLACIALVILRKLGIVSFLGFIAAVRPSSSQILPAISPPVLPLRI